jgi:signal peptidase I
MQDQTIPQPPADNTPVYSSRLPEPPKPKQKKSEGWRSALSTIFILIAAPLVALALTAFVFQSYEVDGPSMETTLQNHDRLIVLKVPRTIARITGNDYIPSRGDVIVFVKAGLQEYGDVQSEKQLIKRVIGLPGDRVVVKDGAITIYNKEHPAGFNPDAGKDWGKDIQTTPGETDVTITEGQVFVSGDNRTNSLDSRYFGPIAAHDIVGKLVVRVFPLNKAGFF